MDLISATHRHRHSASIPCGVRLTIRQNTFFTNAIDIMTYCVALRLNDGLVFLSDSRTNAGVDQIGTYRKMNVYEIPGERVMVMMTAGNLSISQSIRQLVVERSNTEGHNLWTA